MISASSSAFEHELERLATRDPLTGLPNRTLITAQLESALARADRQRRLLAVLFIDIDRVKLVTEALGHRAGDELIAQAADRLRAAAGPAITLGRFSNDQFVAIVEDLDDVGTAVDTAITMIEAVSHPFVVAADEAFVNASVGIAFAIEGLGDAETLVSNADVAMGRAKSSSLSRYEVFDADMRAWVEIQRKTEIALRHGIDRHEFELYYQPVVELESTEVCGYEALVRWNHPDLGLLAPAEFIPVAEESGLIVPLGEQLLRDAIEQSARWRDEPGSTHPSKVAINLSARQLEHPGLVSLVREALERVRRRTRRRHLRDHRDRAAPRRGHRRPHPRRAPGARGAPLARRLRHRLLVVDLPLPAADRHRQGRPQLRLPARHRLAATRRSSRWS